MRLIYENILEVMTLILLILTLASSVIVIAYVFHNFFADIFEDIKRRRVNKNGKTD